MLQIEAGKPVGLSFAPDGNLYVADTHYHRVVVFTPAGKLIHQFGSFGETDGCFIYPTDVAFAGDGRILSVNTAVMIGSVSLIAGTNFCIRLAEPVPSLANYPGLPVWRSITSVSEFM